MSRLFTSGSQSTGASASASALPMNIQDWFPLGLTGWISLQSKGLSTVFSGTEIRKHHLFRTLPSLWFNSHMSVHDYWKKHCINYTFVSKVVSKFVIAFHPRSKCPLISWLQSPSAVTLKPKKIKSITASTFPLSVCHAMMGPDAMILVF